MPRYSKGPRLYLKRLKNRPPVWVIRDGSHETSTGCLADDADGAREALRDYLARHFRPDTSQKYLDKISCAEVLMLYLKDLPADSPSRNTFKYHVKALTAYWGDKTLADVKGSTCREYLSLRVGISSKQTTSAVKPSTARHELKTLQAAINHWHRESPLEAVPKVTLPKVTSKRERVLERSEVANLLWACRRLSRRQHVVGNGGVQYHDYSHVARFILIGLYTGTRHNAVLQLGWKPSKHGGHVDLQRGVLFRRGSDERETSKKRPPVQIPQKLLRRILAWRKKDVQTLSEAGLGTIVVYHGQPVTRMKRAWATVVKEAGLGPDVTPHVLRHTCASWNLWNGKTIWEVAEIIGADASTVERVYGHHRRVE